MMIREQRVGDKYIGTLYLNGSGLGQTARLFPQIMRISVARSGDVLYQLDFFMVDARGKKRRDFELVPSARLQVGDASAMKGALVGGHAESRFLAVVRGELAVAPDWLASFTGQVVFADSAQVAAYSAWGAAVTNSVVLGEQRVLLGAAESLRIVDSILEGL